MTLDSIVLRMRRADQPVASAHVVITSVGAPTLNETPGANLSADEKKEVLEFALRVQDEHFPEE